MGTTLRKVARRTSAPRLVRDLRTKRYGIVYQTQPGRSESFIVNVRRRGRIHTRRFAASKHGGLAAALAAALAWRNTCLADTPVLTLREFHARVRSNNTSGTPGVTFLRPRKQPDGLWQAKISFGDGRRFCRKFSVRKFGAAEAFARAVAARLEFLGLVAERPYVRNRIAKRASAIVSRRHNVSGARVSRTGEAATAAGILNTGR